MPAYSTLSAFLAATQERDEEDLPEPPSLAGDPQSPIACLEAAKREIQSQDVEAAVTLLETAVDVLPEFTDALSLLAAQYLRLGRYSEACEAVLRAIRSPPCFGQRPVRILRWLASQDDAQPDTLDDPIWRVRKELRLVFGGEKENSDYPMLQEAMEQYLVQGQLVEALTLMQTYGQLMSQETISFQERYGFDPAAFRARERDISGRLPGGPRTVHF